jgi:hypothetical protein
VSNKLFIFDNSLRKIASNLKGFGKGMLQGTTLLISFFISDFLWKCMQNKGRHDKGLRLVRDSTSILRTLFRRDPWVRIPSPAHSTCSFWNLRIDSTSSLIIYEIPL